MSTVTAKQTVYLDEDGKPVTEIAKGKRGTLLVAGGTEIHPSRYENIDGAAELIEGKSKKKEDEPKKAAKH